MSRKEDPGQTRCNIPLASEREALAIPSSVDTYLPSLLISRKKGHPPLTTIPPTILAVRSPLRPPPVVACPSLSQSPLFSVLCPGLHACLPACLGACFPFCPELLKGAERKTSLDNQRRSSPREQKPTEPGETPDVGASSEVWASGSQIRRQFSPGGSVLWRMTENERDEGC